MASKKEKKSKQIPKASVKKDAQKTPVKSAKKIVSKPVSKPVVAEIEEHDEEEMIAIEGKGKTKKPLEIDAADILPEVEEKAVIDEENPLLSAEDEESEDAPSLDDEDLNPFGDKWEQ